MCENHNAHLHVMGCLAKDAVEGAGDEQPGDTKSTTHQGCSDRRVAGFFGEQQQSMHSGVLGVLTNLGANRNLEQVGNSLNGN